MSAAKQREHLEQQIRMLQQRFKDDRERHKRLAVMLQAATVSLAGLVTILLGWKEAPSMPIAPVLGNIALILGAAITVVSAYEAFFDPRKLWVRETVVLARLTDLERDLAFAAAGVAEAEMDAGTLEEFKHRLDAILQQSLQEWLQMRGHDEHK